MENRKKPNFTLQSVYDDGLESEPRVYRIDGYHLQSGFGRRDFLKTSAIPLAALLLAGCGGGGGGGGGGGTGDSDPDTVNAAFRADVKAHFGLRRARFSPDGRLIASLGDDAQVKLWQPDNRVLNAFTLEDEARDFTFSPDGSFIAIATPFNVALYDTTTFALLHVFDVADIDPVRLRAAIIDIAVSPGGEIIVNTVQSGVHHWRYPQTDYQGGFATISELPFFMRLRPQGDALVVADGDGSQVQMHAFPSGDLLASFTIRGFPVDLEFSPDGRSLVATSSGRPNSLIIWDQATGSQRHVVAGRFEVGAIHHFLRLVFLPDGRLACSVNRVATDSSFFPAAVIVDVNDGTVTPADGLIGLDGVSPDGARYLADGTLSPWLGGSCGSSETSRLQQGKLDLGAAEPMLGEAWALYSPDATEVGRHTRLHSTRDADREIVYVASSPDLPLEPGAVCTCNSVAGTAAATGRNCTGGGGGGTCTCNTVCICVPVFF